MVSEVERDYGLILDVSLHPRHSPGGVVSSKLVGSTRAVGVDHIMFLEVVVFLLIVNPYSNLLYVVGLAAAVMYP